MATCFDNAGVFDSVVRWQAESRRSVLMYYDVYYRELTEQLIS